MTTSFWQPQTVENGTVRVAVDVTFLRLEPSWRPDARPARPLDGDLVRLDKPTAGFYRYLYNTVGQAYCWWLRRMISDLELAVFLAHPAISIHVLYRHGEPAGFFELDASNRQDVNISYFGLLPHAVGTGNGHAFLCAAVDAASSGSDSGVVRVNTCTADHPQALPTYRRAGFRPLRTVREIWDVPRRLGLAIPDHLRL